MDGGEGWVRRLWDIWLGDTWLAPSAKESVSLQQREQAVPIHLGN